METRIPSLNVSISKSSQDNSLTPTPVSSAKETTQISGGFSLEGFYKKLRESPLSLFSFSEQQARPGSELIASGFGFAFSGNTVHIGGYEIDNLSSADGMTLSFTLPQNISEGTYEAWITNSKGTSRVDNRPIQLVITQNPAPRPVITSVSPLLPSLSDTVTLFGEHLSGITGLYTSLGILQNVSSTDSSVQFRISDFDLIPRLQAIEALKGKIIQVHVVVATPQGYNKDMFVFNVQF